MSTLTRSSVRRGRDVAALMRELRDLGHGIRLVDVRSGRWFDKLVLAVLEREQVIPDEVRFIRSMPERLERTERAIRRASAQAGILGGGAAMLTTGATTLTLQTDGLLGIVALPAAAATIGADMMLRTVLHVRLIREIAGLAGVKLTIDDRSDLAALFALALGLERHEDGADPGRALVERLVHLGEDPRSIGRLGTALLTEGILRNALPVVGLVTSSARNWLVTARIGRAAREFARYRSELDEAFLSVEGASPDAREILIEGIWFMFMSDGPLTDHEAVVLAHLVRLQPEGSRSELLARFVDDEQQWLQRLKGLPSQARGPVLQALEVAAALDDEITASEQAMVDKVASVFDHGNSVNG